MAMIEYTSSLIYICSNFPIFLPLISVASTGYWLHKASLIPYIPLVGNNFNLFKILSNFTF